MIKSSATDSPSAYRSSFWGVCCESGKKYSQVVKQKFHISMAALDASVVPTSQCVSLMVERGGSEYLLCNLKPDSLLQVNLNLYFDKGEKIAFFLKGHGTVHLSGYLIYGENNSLEDSGGIKKSEQNQVTVSFTKNKNKTGNVKENELYGAKESKKAKTASPTKKLTFSPEEKIDNFLKNDAGMFEDVLEEESDEGKNVESPKSMSKPEKNSKVTMKDEESSDEEEEDSSEDDFADIKALQRVAQKRPHASNEKDEDSDEEDDDEEESSSSIEMVKKNPVKDVQNKKLKMNSSTPIQAKKGNQSTNKTSTEVIDLDDSSKPDDMNSSIGRTPMPKKQASSIAKNLMNESKIGEKVSKDQESDSDSDDDDEDMDTSTNKIPNKNLSNLSASTESPRARKRARQKAKKLAAANESKIANESNLSVSNQSCTENEDLSKAQFSKKLPGGIGYEDIRVGNGPIAKKGRLVHVYYTGKLENNKIFDSCSAGKKPFRFKLGVGEVIKGWDLGVEGMKVGGKRRLRIPPEMGYKSQRAGPIPPNSTLYFTVELKAVS
ncbi:46 kDa FK506-binding nuclear protein [Nephila pilipes]|uniref:peptidylprolyl isomerase n=1 Tax=Nephila pilipes TaxID=299642 RepID=A0A8X6NBE6_NEPPI|nr:46 kDa FK506-binding nuclear protein [Nephila pilipes]